FEPEADFKISPNPAIEGQEITLKDKSTHRGKDYGESIVSWEWDIEGVGSAEGTEVKVKWDTAGTYKIELEVEDQDGDDDSCEQSIVVGPANPTANISMSSDAIVLGREVHINGDESKAALEREIRWDEMEWEIYDPDGNRIPYAFNKSHLFNDEQGKTNEIINKTGNWKFRLKVKDSKDNESEWAERVLQVFPDNPPKADFWLTNESLRNSYKGNQLTIYDQSETSMPDGSLGDEITQRDWTLYYDSNNNGSFTDSADEVIKPNISGKSAYLETVSSNDTNPKIRFSKTGRYKVELAVTESSVIWGDIVVGQSDSTSDKVSEEKEITVINLAPTVAFDIKKKVPVDVLFATDYTVSDAKYSSLQSGQAEFINKLIGGYVDPTIEINKVGDELAEVFKERNEWNFGGYYHNCKNFITNMVETSTPGVFNYELTSEANLDLLIKKKSLNLDTGKSDYVSYPEKEKVIEYTNVYGKDTPSYYDASSPTDSLLEMEDFTYNRKYKIKARSGFLGVYLQEGLVNSVSIPVYSNFDRPLEIISTPEKTMVFYQQVAGVEAQSTFSSKLFVYIINQNNGQIINKVLDNIYFKYNVPPEDFYFDISATVKYLGNNRVGIFTYSKNGIRENKKFTIKEHVSLIVFNDKEDFWLLINNIENDMYSGDRFSFVLSELGDNYICFRDARGIGRITPIDYRIYNNDGQYIMSIPSTILFPTPQFESGISDYEWGSRRTLYNYDWVSGDIVFFPVENSFGYTHFDYTRDEYGFTTTTGCKLKYYKNGQFLWQKNLWDDLNLFSGLDNYGFARKRFYDNADALSLKGNYFCDIMEGSLFKDCIVIKTRSTTGNNVLLVNKMTGETIKEFEGYSYAWNNEDYLFLQKQEQDGIGVELYCYSQLQGLQYVDKILNEHSWDANNFNFIVSVTDGPYMDFNSGKADIEALLRNNHVKFASISPTLAKLQTEEIANNGEGGFWVQTADTMPGPLQELADK
ncbi:MAG TPA: hypothetical protein DC024_11715, partial [Clostridiales bacterium]|nr:hypothetical protein [Clostridiales bacterium]